MEHENEEALSECSEAVYGQNYEMLRAVYRARRRKRLLIILAVLVGCTVAIILLAQYYPRVALALVILPAIVFICALPSAITGEFGWLRAFPAASDDPITTLRRYYNALAFCLCMEKSVDNDYIPAFMCSLDSTISTHDGLSVFAQARRSELAQTAHELRPYKGVRLSSSPMVSELTTDTPTLRTYKVTMRIDFITTVQEGTILLDKNVGSALLSEAKTLRLLWGLWFIANSAFSASTHPNDKQRGSVPK